MKKIHEKSKEKLKKHHEKEEEKIKKQRDKEDEKTMALHLVEHAYIFDLFLYQKTMPTIFQNYKLNLISEESFQSELNNLEENKTTELLSLTLKDGHVFRITGSNQWKNMKTCIIRESEEGRKLISVSFKLVSPEIAKLLINTKFESVILEITDGYAIFNVVFITILEEIIRIRINSESRGSLVYSEINNKDETDVTRCYIINKVLKDMRTLNKKN